MSDGEIFYVTYSLSHEKSELRNEAIVLVRILTNQTAVSAALKLHAFYVTACKSRKTKRKCNSMHEFKTFKHSRA